MDQPQESRPYDASQVSPVDQGVEGLSINSPSDQTSPGDEDHPHEKTSLMSKIKNKAKDKIHKAKDKLTKKPKQKEEDGDEEAEDNDDDDVEGHPKDLLNNPTRGYAADDSYVNHGKPVDNFGVKQTRRNTYSNAGDEQLQSEYDGFQRNAKGETDGDSREFTSVPTDYSSPRASVDAVMPDPIINPGSASDLGEQSSASLGEIPEKPKEEEKVVATEAPEEYSSPSFGQDGDTSRDKLPRTTSDERDDMEAIERDSMSQELGDSSKETKFAKRPSGSITQQHVEGGQESPVREPALPEREAGKGTDGESEPFTEKSDRELPSDEAALSKRESEKGTGELPSGEAAAVSRGSDKPSERPLRDPDVEMPVPQLADFTDTMFSSKDADDLRDGADSTGRTDDSQGQGGFGARDKSFEYSEGNTTHSNSSRAYDQDDQVQESTDTAEKEQFHDPQLDESSLQKQTSTSSYTDEQGEEKPNRAENTTSHVYEEEEGKTPSGTGLLANVTSAVGSALGTVGTKVGYYPTHEHTGSDTRSTDVDEETASDEPEPEPEDQGQSWTQRSSQKRIGNLPPITPQNSSVDGLASDNSAPPSQSWIKKAVGMLYAPSNEKEGTIEEEEEAREQEGGEVERKKPEKTGAERETFADASDSFVQ